MANEEDEMKRGSEGKGDGNRLPPTAHRPPPTAYRLPPTCWLLELGEASA